MPEFYMILAEKVSKYPNFNDICPKNEIIPSFYMIFARKMPELYIKLPFPPIFLWGHVSPCPPSPTPMLMRKYVNSFLKFT